MNDPKREEIKARIAAAQARDEARAKPSVTEKIEDRALETKDKVTEFVKEHPIATVAGGLVLGIAIAAMFKGPRRAAVQTGSKALGLAAMGRELALGFAAQMRDEASVASREGARRLEDIGDSVGDAARSLRREASYRADRAGDAARIASRDAGKAIARRLGKR